ncbi:MAG: hypothetical protein HY606_00065 [Planctomycetes bacterium]|nr:hypothetical protein [Planctomycetota bacterium]
MNTSKQSVIMGLTKWVYDRIKSRNAIEVFINNLEMFVAGIEDNVSYSFYIKSVEEYLLKYLSNSNLYIARSALGAFKHAKDVKIISEQLGKGWKVEPYLIDSFGELNAIQFKEKIAEFLSQKNDCETIYTDPKSLEAVKMDIEKKKIANENTRSAIRTLVKFNAVEYVEKIAEMLDSERSDLVCDAMWAISSFKMTRYNEKISSFLDNDALHLHSKYAKSLIQESALQTLGELRAIEYASKVSKFLEHNSMKIKAIDSLGSMKAAQYEDKLLEMFENGGDKVKSHIIEAFGNMGLKKHAKMIAGYLDSDCVALVAASIKALGVLGAREYEEKLRGMRGDKRMVTMNSERIPRVSDCVEQVLKEWELQDGK